MSSFTPQTILSFSDCANMFLELLLPEERKRKAAGGRKMCVEKHIPREALGQEGCTHHRHPTSPAWDCKVLTFTATPTTPG